MEKRPILSIIALRINKKPGEPFTHEFGALIWVHLSFWCKRPGGLRTSLARRIGGIDHCIRSAHIIVLADVALPFTKIFTLRVNRFLHVNATHSQGSYF
jgi:hypothetical protein